MKKLSRAILLLLLLALLSSCSPGHDGSKVIAFIRNGELWTLDPNGANAFTVVSQPSPTMSFSWSPNHRLLAYRSLDQEFQKTPAAKNIRLRTAAGIVEDVPSTLNTIGVDGGTPIAIAFSRADVQYNTPIWSTDNNRLIYRQTQLNFSGNPSTINWWISQNDQPGGIAIKAFPGSFSIPSFSYNTQNHRILGNATQGVFTTTITGSDKKTITQTVLTNHPLPASLERVLWQPNSQDQRFLYATREPSSSSEPANLAPIQLLLGSTNGATIPLASCECTQFAWSPDGKSFLYATNTNYTLVNVADKTSFAVNAQPNAIPYWSHDSRFLLFSSNNSLQLFNLGTQKLINLLGMPPAQDTRRLDPELPATNALLQPVPNSLWSPDNTSFTFLVQDSTPWQQQTILTPGLYTVSLNEQGQPTGPPTRIATGPISQIGWSYQDHNTSFLF